MIKKRWLLAFPFLVDATDSNAQIQTHDTRGIEKKTHQDAYTLTKNLRACKIFASSTLLQAVPTSMAALRMSSCIYFFIPPNEEVRSYSQCSVSSTSQIDASRGHLSASAQGQTWNEVSSLATHVELRTDCRCWLLKNSVSRNQCRVFQAMILGDKTQTSV